jgi:3-methyladenine DNA glycosylase AlkD
MTDASLPAADRALIEELRAALVASADPARAPAMQAYMKSTMPYRGVASTPLRALVRAVEAAHPLPTFEAWRDTLLAIWREATHREERYAALEIAGRPRYRAYRTREALPLYEEFIVSGAWWDLVDGTAHLLRDLVRDDHEWMAARMREWAADVDLWKRRAAIISQLGLRSSTDWLLLRECIEASLEDRPENHVFWIRKAIGWALREYAKTVPEVVAAYVEALGPRLSPLSRREALKHLGSAPAPRKAQGQGEATSVQRNAGV